MKKSFCVALLAAAIPILMMVPSAVADWPTGDNMLSLYSANDGTGTIRIGTPSAPVTGAYSIFLVATGVTDPSGIIGWECHIIVPGTVFFTGVVYNGQAINVATAPDFAVGLAQALPPDASNAVVLATVSFFVQGMEGLLLLHPTTVPSIPNEMVYALGSDPGILRPFNRLFGDVDRPVFGFNSEPLPVTQTTWGQLKDLYR